MIWDIKIENVGTVSYELHATTYGKAWREAKAKFGAAALDLSRPARSYKQCTRCESAPCLCEARR